MSKKSYSSLAKFHESKVSVHDSAPVKSVCEPVKLNRKPTVILTRLARRIQNFLPGPMDKHTQAWSVICQIRKPQTRATFGCETDTFVRGFETPSSTDICCCHGRKRPATDFHSSEFKQSKDFLQVAKKRKQNGHEYTATTNAAMRLRATIYCLDSFHMQATDIPTGAQWADSSSSAKRQQSMTQ